MKKQVLNTQSLLDIALQELGDISGIFELLELGNLSITDQLTAGSELELPPQPANKQITGYYSAHRLTPATAITIDSTDEGNNLLLEGIEFWGIEYDFTVI